MAATWVSNSGVGTAPNSCRKISMSCRAAWNTFSTASSAQQRAQRGQVQPGAWASITAISAAPPSCTTQSSG